jgi:hypothetical protein
MQRYHDRMPCMLEPKDFDACLDGSAGTQVLLRLPRELREWIVSNRVNKAGAGDDDPSITPEIGNLASRPSTGRRSGYAASTETMRSGHDT